MESLLDFVKRRLLAVDRRSWEVIAAAANVAKSTPRQIVYRSDRNFALRTVERVAMYFQAVDDGDMGLPIFSAECGWWVPTAPTARKPAEQSAAADSEA